MRTVRSLVVTVVTVSAVLALGACSSEPAAAPDDGAQVVPLAGLGPQVLDAGVDVLSPDVPVAATADDVGTALDDAGLDTPTVTRVADVAANSFGFDPIAVAGLIAVVTDAPGTAVVLVFASPSAAAVFAAGDPEVFTDAAAEDARDAVLTGNVVAYASARKARVLTALEALSGRPAPQVESPTDGPTDSASASPSETASS